MDWAIKNIAPKAGILLCIPERKTEIWLGIQELESNDESALDIENVQGFPEVSFWNPKAEYCGSSAFTWTEIETSKNDKNHIPAKRALCNVRLGSISNNFKQNIRTPPWRSPVNDAANK